MYVSVRRGQFAPRAVWRPGVGTEDTGVRGIDRNVVNLGLTSLFTDISSESVTAILPLYLATRLGFAPLEIGAFLGLYQALTVVLNVVGGVVADRTVRRKEVAVAGYGVSSLARLGMVVAGAAWMPTALLLAVDRTGKGIRTAPRDALISVSAGREQLGTAFGIHRALDTAGAVIGPFLAFWLLSIVPDQFDVVFLASFCASVVGVAVIVLFVRDPSRAAEPQAPRRAVPLRDIVGLVRRPGYAAVAAAALILSVVTVSDAFVYLTLQQRSTMTSTLFPLLYVGTALAYLVLAVPLGMLADRVGRARVFIAGTSLLVALDAILLGDPGPVAIVAVLALLGAYYAATDGVLMALASPVVPSALRTSGLAGITTLAAVGRLIASVLFGAVWSAAGPRAAVLGFLVALCAALPVGAMLLTAAMREHS